MAKASVPDLLEPMLKRQMYVATSRLVPGQSLDALLADHLEYMIGLEATGHLFASGPLLDEDGNLTGEGLTILRADTLDAARQLAEADPFVRAGVRTVEISAWRLMEGRIGLSVDLSRGTFSFD